MSGMKKLTILHSNDLHGDFCQKTWMNDRSAGFPACRDKKMFKSSYSREYDDYVCVNQLGELMKPSYVTEHFAAIIQELGLRTIRFHDLRHPCASVLLAQGVPMKQIQEWLGHSDMSTTANIYSHLDAVSKADTGAAMSKALG